MRSDGPVDLAVAPALLATAAVEREPRMVIAHGDATDALKAAGYASRTYFPIPSAEEPRAWLPLDSPNVSTYALRRWTVASTRLKRVRNELLSQLIAGGRAPLRSSWVTVGAPDDPVPAFVRGATSLLDVHDPEWFLTVGTGESLDYRGVFHLFERDPSVPRWIAKFARRSGMDDTFARDGAGLALAASGGPVVRAHAPESVAVFEHEGIPASIETAAPGAALSAVLRARGGRQAKLEIIERVAGWIVEVAASTSAPGAGRAELERLASEVFPAWKAFGLEDDLVPVIGEVPGILQHNDLWSENVIVHDDDFMVVDWEDARPDGLPLWDLVYFLRDALALLDGAYGGRAQNDHFVSLFKGTGRSSPVLFKWVRQAAQACSVPPDAVGPIVTACWLSQVLTHVTRGEDAARFAVHGLSKLPPGERWANLWLSDPELGPRWSSWRS